YGRYGEVATAPRTIERRRSGGRGLEQPQPFEASLDRFALLGGGLDERQPVAADVVTEQVQRGLDRNRIRRHAQEIDRRTELLVEGARALDSSGPEPA